MNTFWRRCALAVLVLAAAPWGVARADGCAVLFAGATPPLFTDLRLAQGIVLLCNDAFAVAASPVTRGALWSAEHPTAASVSAARQIPREGDFHADDRLAPGSRAELEDYRDSGFDRGHLAPSGDMPTPEAQQQSFSLANMVPQTAVLNRGLWERIESAVRRLAEQQGALYVVTGPAFLSPRLKAIGPNNVLVPTALWKAVYDPVLNGTGAYFCPNTQRPACRTMPVAQLTRMLGVDPFPAVPAAVKARLMTLPDPGPPRTAGRTAGHNRRPPPDRGFFDRLLNPTGAPAR